MTESALLSNYSKYLPECVSCGACCHANLGDDAHYVTLQQGDFARLPVAARAEVDHCEVRTAEYRCGSKRGEVRCACALLDKRDHKRCTVYKDRPQVCRDFRRGGPECIREYLAFYKCLGRDV